MSVLINAKPTVEVVADSPFVRVGHGRVVITQPTPITVVGTAQPPAGNLSTVVEVFGLDAQGNVLNNGQPLTTATTNFLGRYRATFELPSTIRADMNSIIVRQQAVGFLDGTQTIDATTLTGLTGDLAINGTTLENLQANLSLNPGTISNLQGNLSLNPGTISNLQGNLSLNPGTISNLQGNLSLNPGTISNLQGNLSLNPGTISNLQGDVSINGFDSDLDGTVAATEGLTDEIFGTLEIDIDVVGVGAGEFESDGPIAFDVSETEVTGTITTPDLSGSLSNGTADESGRTGSLSNGTADESDRTGTLSGGTGDESGRTGTLSDGTGDESGRTGTLSNGVGQILPTTGTFTQTGEAIIAPTTGTIRLDVNEFAVSDPLTIYIHQSHRRVRPLPVPVGPAALNNVERPTRLAAARMHSPAGLNVPRPNLFALQRPRPTLAARAELARPDRLPTLPARNLPRPAFLGD